MPTSSWYMQPVGYSEASENGMEALELNMPSDTVNIPASLPPLEDISMNSQDQE